MPPANSPSDSRAISPNRDPPLARQEWRHSLVPDRSPPSGADDVHDDNVDFLRFRFSPEVYSAISRRRRRHQNITENFDVDPMDIDEPHSLRAAPLESNRPIPIVRHRGEELTDVPNYEAPTSSRSLYGWAPHSETDNEHRYDSQNTDALSAWYRRHAVRRAESEREPRRETPPTISLSRSPRRTTEETADRNRHGPSSGSTEDMSESQRRENRFPRARALQLYLLDRGQALDQSIQRLEERERQRTSSRAHRFVPHARAEPHNSLTHNDLRARLNAHRRMHMENRPNPQLKETLRYLDHLRYSNSYEESIASAVAGGFLPVDSAPWDDDDFVLDTTSIAPPGKCSWLRPGMVFTGSQKAANSAGSIFAQAALAGEAEATHGSGNGGSRINVHTTGGRRYLANNLYNMGCGRDEDWPVKVTLHDINYEEMTMSGTMEAYNMPDKTHPSHDAHIVTFLEGEIIDFNKHTLETKNFTSDPEIDITYWRELQPFRNLRDHELMKNLVSRKWITEKLAEQYILMRWKERCFITPTDARQGLTISGFYYISIHRPTGEIDGLYYDPGSSPYQELRLKPEKPSMTCPSYQFR